MGEAYQPLPAGMDDLPTEQGASVVIQKTNPTQSISSTSRWGPGAGSPKLIGITVHYGSAVRLETPTIGTRPPLNPELSSTRRWASRVQFGGEEMHHGPTDLMFQLCPGWLEWARRLETRGGNITSRDRRSSRSWTMGGTTSVSSPGMAQTGSRWSATGDSRSAVQYIA